MQLAELSGEQIAAIATGVAAILGALAMIARDSAQRAVAPLSGPPPGTFITIEAKAVTDLTEELKDLRAAVDMNNIALQDKGAQLKRNSSTIVELCELVDRSLDTLIHHTKVVDAQTKQAEELVQETRELRNETRNNREEIRRLQEQLLRRGPSLP